MSFVMTAEEREAFLCDVHVGVLAVEREGRAPLAVPVWYDYRGGEIMVWTDRGSVKERAVRRAGRFSLAVQKETAPYAYVVAEGAVAATDRAPTRAEATSIAARYLPPGDVANYVDGALGDGSVLLRMRPEHWLSNDRSKT